MSSEIQFMRTRILYQPSPIDAINSNSIIIRKTSEQRLNSMINFSNEYFKNNLKNKTFLDVGCSIGYFLNGMKDICKSVTGIENNQLQLFTSQLFYKNIFDKIIQGDLIEELPKLKQYNIVSFLSVLHMIMQGNSEQMAVEVMQMIDQKTKDILFFEMAEGREINYQNTGWTPDSIVEYVLSNTSFKYYKSLFVDSDGVGDFEGNFGRTLFAFYRNEIK